MSLSSFFPSKKEIQKQYDELKKTQETKVKQRELPKTKGNK